MLVKEKASLTTIASPAHFFKQLLINNKTKTVGWDQTAHTPDHQKEVKQVKIPIKLYLQIYSYDGGPWHRRRARLSTVLYALIYGVFWNDTIHVAEGHGIFFFIIQKKKLAYIATGCR